MQRPKIANVTSTSNQSAGRLESYTWLPNSRTIPGSIPGSRAHWPDGVFSAPDVASREELLAQESTPEVRALYDSMFAMMDSRDREDLAPSDGLTFARSVWYRQPDGNTINIL